MPRRLILGRVAGAFGVQGWVRIQSHTDPVDALLRYQPWWIVDGQGEAYETTPAHAKAHGPGLVAQLRRADGEVTADRNQALQLLDCQIEVERSVLPEPPAGQYYWVDLEGCTVINGDGRHLGVVHSLMSNGPQAILRVRREKAPEQLIPFVHGPIVQSVDLQVGEIRVDWHTDD
ncbi:MAG: ribosome maturation factor RimM [Panacagrimonas sp.]